MHRPQEESQQALESESKSWYGHSRGRCVKLLSVGSRGPTDSSPLAPPAFAFFLNSDNVSKAAPIISAPCGSFAGGCATVQAWVFRKPSHSQGSETITG